MAGRRRDRGREATINKESEIREAIESAKTIAVVGCSPNPARPSHSIALYLQESGYRVIPVNPGHRELLGEKCYPSIEAIPPEVRIDIVDVFRRSSEVGPIADQAIRRGVGFFFVLPIPTAPLEAAAGIPVAMDRCILVERERYERVRS